VYLLYCDETNFQKKSGDFFVYGGVVIPPDAAAAVADDIERLRSGLAVPKDYIFKFNPGPAGFSHERFIELKKATMEVAAKHGLKLLVNLLLHDIAKSSEDARLYGVNTLCYHFDCFLHRPQSHGLVLIDRFNDKSIDGQLQEKLAVGLTGPLPYGDSLKLKRIVGYHYTAIGQSHFCSLIDVLLGSLRFAINAFTQGNAAHVESANTMLQQLAPLFLEEHGVVSPISFWFSPKEVRHAAYRERYLALKGYLTQQGIKIGQDL
jgi:hypothetical protein